MSCILSFVASISLSNSLKYFYCKISIAIIFSSYVPSYGNLKIILFSISLKISSSVIFLSSG